MKRSNQLMLESAVIASLIVGLTLGGTIGSIGVPSAWENLPNPVSIAAQYNYADIALLYNTTLTQLAAKNFTGVSYSLDQFAFLNYPTKLNTTIATANAEISGISVAMPLALKDLNLSQSLVTSGQVVNASSHLQVACSIVNEANINYTEFRETTTPELGSLSVPVSLYAGASNLVNSSISRLSNQCQLLSSELNGLANFTISTTQTSLETGGLVQVQGDLTFGPVPLANDTINLYLNGTKFATTNSYQNGFFSVNSSTPYAYNKTAAIWAVASPVQSVDFAGAVSNTLYLELIYNQTQIVISDPLPVLPTFNFTVSGKLTSTSGALPNAPIRISSFDANYTTTTNEDGMFTYSLTVPANATDAQYTIYAYFAPDGVLGPSVNYTTIEVVHEPLSVTINHSSQAYSGLSEKVSGVVMANNSALPLSNVTVIAPWGDFLGSTNANGEFSVSVSIPIWEFGLSSHINVTASPSQAYIKTGSGVSAIPIINPLEIAFPIIVGGVVVYELGNLGILERRKPANAKDEVEATVRNLFSQASVSTSKATSKLVEIYKEALLLAVRKYNLGFLPSATIREIISQVRLPARDLGVTEFTTISLLLEDLLYARSFDERKIVEAEEALSKLEKIWGAL